MAPDRPQRPDTDPPEDPGSQVIDLSSREGFRPNLGSMAQRRVTAARAALGLSPGEFAEVLAPLLGWTPQPELVRAWETRATPPGDVLLAAGIVARDRPGSRLEHDSLVEALGDRFSDVTAVYATRVEFASELPPARLFGTARSIRIAGLSLNLLCQQFGLGRLQELIEAGTTVDCLFLDPAGAAIRQREAEEHETEGQLSTLTEINIQVLTRRVRDRLTPQARGRLRLAVYDQPIRFHVILVDDELCVVQPYLPVVRGLDCPTFVIRRRWPTSGLYPVFETLFRGLWSSRRQL